MLEVLRSGFPQDVKFKNTNHLTQHKSSNTIISCSGWLAGGGGGLLPPPDILKERQSHGGLRRKTDQITSQNLHRWRTCEIYAPWGDMWTCPRWAACSSVSTMIRTHENWRADSSAGWSGVGGVRWFTWGPRAAVANEDENQREMRRRREGGGLEGARGKYKYAADWWRQNSKTRPPPHSLLPTTFQNFCVTLIQHTNIFNLCRPDNSI